MGSSTLPAPATSATSARRARSGPSLLGSLAYLLLNLPIGIVSFVVLVTLLSVGVSTSVVWLGIPVLALMLLLVRGAGRLERARLYALLDTWLPVPYRPLPEVGRWQRWKTRLSDPGTWRDLLYFLLLFPIGIAEFTILVAVWSACLWLLSLPLFFPWLPVEWHPDIWGHPLGVVDTWPDVLPWTALGILLLGLALPLTRGLAMAHGWFASALLVRRESREQLEPLEPPRDPRDRQDPSGALPEGFSRISPAVSDGRMDGSAQEGPAMAAEQAPANEVARPPALGALAFMVLSFPLRLAQFILVVTLLAVGFGTVVIWVGVPLLLLAVALVRAFGDLERKWVRKTLRTPIPPARRAGLEDGRLRNWPTRLKDPTTWRDLAYLLVAFPLGIVEFALGLAGIVLFPVAMWVLPGLGWLHGQLALALLGPPRSDQLAARASRLQASRARGVDAAEAERKRIERDLHDGAQQRLVSVAMSLGRAKSRLNGNPEAVRELIDEAHADAKLAVSELRDLARGIYPAVLADRGLDAALSAQAAKSPIPVDVRVDVDPRPPAAVETTAYFIVGETLANVAKHAAATEAMVRVWRDDEAGGTIVVEVTDNGRGGAEMTSGGGLSGLADRAATIDGVISVVSPVGGPTVVRADLPCAW